MTLCSSAKLTWATCLIAMASCSHAPAAHRTAVPELDPVPIRAVDDWNAQVVLRQTITAHWSEEQSHSFEAVLEKKPGELTLLGLGPMNTVGFVLRHTQQGVNLENRSNQTVPFSPEHVIADIQRVLYPWFDEPLSCTECTRKTHRDGIAVLERAESGSLVERRFRNATSEQDTTIVINYEQWDETGSIPQRATITHKALDYTLRIETHSIDFL